MDVDKPVVRSAEWQADLRAKLTDLRGSLTNRWCRWDDWERQFITDITANIDTMDLGVTPKQYDKIVLLWERSLR